MNGFKRLKNKSGFTLPEVIITVGVFSLFTLSLLGTLVMGLRYLNMADEEIVAQQNCRNITDVVITELRQAVPNPAPGSTGYLA